MKSARLLLSLVFVAACTNDPSATVTPAPDAGSPSGEGGAGETCAPITGSGTTHAKNVESNETWTAAGSPHIVTSPIAVLNGSTLTIEPCAEVRMAKDTSIDVASPSDSTGVLKAEGTAQKPIKIIGNVPGERWRQIFVRVPGGKATLRHVTLEGGGADLETMHATLFVRGPGEWPSRRDVLVDHVTIKGSQAFGAVFDRAAAFADGSSDLVVEGAGDFPLRIGEAAIHTLPKGKYTGNATDEILVYEDAVSPGSGLRENATMKDHGVPYRIGQGTNKRMAVEGATLTIEPGVKLRFEKDASFVVHHQNEDAVAQAAVVAVGTAANPIVFTSAAAAPAAGNWIGLYFGGKPLGTNRLEHVRIEYAGAECLCGGSTCSDIGGKHDSAIHIPRQPAAGFSVTNTTFANIDGHGVHRAWVGTNAPSFIATNTFTNVSGCPQTLPFPEGGTCPDPMPACE
jgi:hypothetical protein